MKQDLISQELPIVILCGGKSRRMGEDKALLPFSSYSSLSAFQYERLKKVFSKVYLSSKVNKFDFKCDLILEKDTIYSPLVALKTILEDIKEEQVFILTVDTPFVCIKTINKLINSSKNFDITVAKTEKLHSLTGVFSKSVLPKINEMLDEDFHKVGHLLKQVNTNIITFEDDDEFINLNHQEDYEKAKKLKTKYE